MTDLFPDTIQSTKRKPPRVLMHVVDAGDHFGEHEGAVIAVMQCNRCKHQTYWTVFKNVTEAKKGIPCPKCN